jgi:hypothetical protein
VPRAPSIIFALLIPLAASARDPTPAYLPRAAFIGTYVNTALTPQLRFQWELTLIQREKNALVVLLEGGGGYGLLLPSSLGPGGSLSMTRLYQLTALAGVGFRADEADGWHWGGQLATGPLFYGARFNDRSTEDSVWPMLEARAQLGLRYGSTVYGIAVGYAFTYPGLTRSVTTPFLAGPMVGFFADRR